jgi:hypothetical protein
MTMTMITIGRSLGVVILLLPFAANAWTAGDEERCPARGPYENADYGFRVTLPAKASGCPNSPVGMSDHGVTVPLPEYGGEIEVFAAYDIEKWELKEASESVLSWLRQAAKDEKVEIVSQAQTKLGDLPAIRTVTLYTDSRDGIRRIDDGVVAVRNIAGRQYNPVVLYSIHITVRQGRYDASRSTFEKLLRTWQLTPNVN